MRGLQGKVAVVTGGARGIGRATVERLRAEGMHVTALDVLGSEGALLQRELAASPSATFIRCDVTKEREVSHAFAQVITSRGRVDLLVNNAGVNAYYDAARMTSEEWDQVMDVDLKGAWLCAKHAIAPMREQSSGVILNVASIHAVQTTEGMFPYAAAKSGVIGLTRSLALDEGKNGIRINAVLPGFIETTLTQEWLDRQPNPETVRQRLLDRHPLGRIGTPADIAAFLAFLASDDAAFATAASFVVDGGLTAGFTT